MDFISGRKKKKELPDRKNGLNKPVEYGGPIFDCPDQLPYSKSDRDFSDDSESDASGIAVPASETSVIAHASDLEKNEMHLKQQSFAWWKGRLDLNSQPSFAFKIHSEDNGGNDLPGSIDETILNALSNLPDSIDETILNAVLNSESVPGSDADWRPVSYGFADDRYRTGSTLSQVSERKRNYCPECGTKAVIEKPAVTLDKVQFSAVAPRTFAKGDYSLIEIIMYEEAFRHVVEEAVANADEPVKEKRSGILIAERRAKITVTISTPDFEIEDNTEDRTWLGGYLTFSFAVEVPEQYAKEHIPFTASVYINDIISTRLKFVAKCKSATGQKVKVTRKDIFSAFVSYASQDRRRVALIIQGMKKARPDMDIFFDVDSLRSGDYWEKALWSEIDKRDILFLCWSKNARASKWVDAEWRYALKHKGPDSIEPVPIDPPGTCPPPDELSRKYFNDKLLYIINSNP